MHAGCAVRRRPEAEDASADGIGQIGWPPHSPLQKRHIVTVEMNQRLGPSQLCHLCRASAALAANSLYAMGQCISGCRLWLPALRLAVLCGKVVGRKHLGHLVARWLPIVTSFSSCHTTIFANIVQVMKVVGFHEECSVVGSRRCEPARTAPHQLLYQTRFKTRGHKRGSISATSTASISCATSSEATRGLRLIVACSRADF